jgi:hypothetical protein
MPVVPDNRLSFKQLPPLRTSDDSTNKGMKQTAIKPDHPVVPG